MENTLTWETSVAGFEDFKGTCKHRRDERLCYIIRGSVLVCRRGCCHGLNTINEMVDFLKKGVY